MAEYIERTDLRKTLKKEMQILKETPGKDDWDKGIIQGIKESIMHLNVAPSASVVEVVRCETCNQFRRYTKVNQNFGVCRRSKMEVSWHDFCSYGERKEG